MNQERQASMQGRSVGAGRTYAFALSVARPGEDARYLSWVAALLQLLLGLSMLFPPARYVDLAYGRFYGHLTLYGMVLVAAALGLLVWQVLPLGGDRLPRLSLLFSALIFETMVTASLHAHDWTAAGTYSVLAAALLVASVGGDAWLRSRRGDLFLLTVTLERLLAGATFLALALHVLAPAEGQPVLHSATWGVVALLTGALLVLCQLLSRRRYAGVLCLLASALLLLWAYGVGLRQDLVAILIPGLVLAGGVGLRPLLPTSWFAPPQLRLANRLVAASVLLVGTALIVLAAIFLHQSESAYQLRATEDLTTTAEVVAQESAGFINAKIQEMALYSRDPEMQDFDLDQQLAFTHRIMAADPSISQMSVVNSSGVTVLRSTGERPGVDRQPLFPELVKLLQSHEPSFSVVVSPTQAVPVLALRVPILTPDGAFRGALVSQVRLSVLTDQLGALPSGKDGRIIIVDGNGHVVVHPDPRLVAQQADLSARPPVAAAISGKPAPMVDREGKAVWLSAAVPVPGVGWTVLVERPRAEVLAPAERVREQALVCLVLMLLLASAMAVLFARRFSRPVTQLALAVRQFGEGSIDDILPSATSDEVGDLVRAFADMRAALVLRTREVEGVLKAAAELNAAVEPEDVLLQVVGVAAELVTATRVSILIREGDHLTTWRSGVPGEWQLRGSPVPMEASPAGWVVEHGMPYRSGDLQRETAFRWQHPDGSLRTLLAVPVLGRSGEVAAVLALFNRRDGQPFTDEDQRLAEGIAHHASVALERALLLARARDSRAEVEALLAATASLGVQGEPDEVLRTLIEQAAGLLDAETVSYATGCDGNIVFRGTWCEGRWIENARTISQEGSILGMVWQSAKPYRTNDLEHDPSSNREADILLGYRSQLTAPLVGSEGEPVGLIAAYNCRRAEGFSERDQRLLVAVCEYGSAVLRRADDASARAAAEQDANRRRREVEALLDVADRLSTATEQDEVLQIALGVVAELLGIDRVGVATNQGDHALSRGFWADGAWDAASATTRIPLDESVTGWVIRNARTYRSEDSTTDPLFYGRRIAVLKGVKVGGVVSVPVMGRDGTVLAVLHLHERNDGRPLSEADQRLVEGIAHHAGVALERAGLVRELRGSEEELKRQAYFDSLTGLPNRVLFLDRLSQALTSPREGSGGVALLFVDLDGFKLVNDSLGHAAGDELLVAVGRRLLSSQRSGDTVARFGGDEFAVLLDPVNDIHDAVRVADRLLAESRRPFKLRRRQITLAASVGIAFRKAGVQGRAEDLLREADIALYRAKAAGKAQAVVFNTSMSRQAVERMNLATDLRRAVERDQLRLYYQPIVELRGGTIVGVEALLRWKHPRRGLLMPDSFIPLAESTGLILPIGQWALEEACRQAQRWAALRAEQAPLRMSVNVSARQLEQPDLVEQVERALRMSAVEPGSLELELTEGTLMQNTGQTVSTLAALKSLGVRLAIDDFGKGYSSLGYLERLAVDTVKIDASFIEGLHRDKSCPAIVQAVIALGHALGVSVTAEGIGDTDQVEFLRGLACDLGQGYHFAGPLPEYLATVAVERGRASPLPR